MHRNARLTAGLVLATLLALLDAASLLDPSGGPAPLAVNLADGVLGLLTLAGVIAAVRGQRRGIAVVVATRGLSALSSLPAFVADVPATVRVIVAVGLAVTAFCIYLIAPRLYQSELTVSH